MNTLFPKSILRSRILRLQQKLREYPEAVTCIGTSAVQTRTRDSLYPYKQNNDFLYLTGAPDLQGAVLVISSDPKKSILFGAPFDKKKELWDGPQDKPEELAELLGVTFAESRQQVADAQTKLIGHRTMIFQGEQFTLGSQVLQSVLAQPVFNRGSLPSVFVHADTILGELRLHKEAFEIDAIRRANVLTADALYSVLTLLQSSVTEKEIARAFQFSVEGERSSCSFDTIIASGKNAATLHHTPGDTKLKRGNMVLIDCGATYLGYAGDLSRTLPVEAPFSESQRALYQAVLSAQKASIKAIKPGVTIKSVHLAAVKELSYALSDLKIIRKKPAEIVKGGLYKEFFPHGIGHSLGLDVHDVGELRSLSDVTLNPGMVLTVEPGLYSNKKQAEFAPFGIRIEDDIAVTKTGNENLSLVFPKEIKDVEAMLGL